MATVRYLSSYDDAYRGNLNLGTDTIKAMLVTSGYAEDKIAHSKRSQVTNEVAAGAGYALGGVTVPVTLTKDDANNRYDILFGQAQWTVPAGQTLTARKIIYYKARGGAASADELLACVDFGADLIASGGTLTVAPTRLRDNNAA